MTECQHNIVTTTHQRGPYCCECDRPLVGIFDAIPRDTPAGALLYAIKQAAQPPKEQP